MQTHYKAQKELMQARIDTKSCEKLLANLITKGTSCSPFESKVIVEKAKGVFSIGEYAEGQRIREGQLIWLCIAAEEHAGKSLKDCGMKGGWC